MSRKIEFILNEDPQQAIRRARRVAESNGVHMVGTAAAGKFTGHGLEGHYTVAGNTVAIIIHRKPMLVPWSLVENRLHEFFAT